MNPTVDPDDILLPMGMHGASGGPTFINAFRNGEGSVDLTMTPVKWWTYDGRFDEDTGEPT